MDPYSVGVHDCAAEIYRSANDHESAIGECKRILAIDPYFVPAFIKLGKTYLQRSMFGEGVQAMEKALELSHGGLLAKAYLAYAYGIVGRTGEARALISDLEQSSASRYVSPFNLAIAFAGLADKTATMEWLRKAYELRTSTLAKINVDPIFDFLRSDPRFAQLQRDMGLLAPGGEAPPSPPERVVALPSPRDTVVRAAK